MSRADFHRPAREAVVRFITEHQDHQAPDPVTGGVGLRWGVEPMCAVLTEHGIKISPSTYYEWVDKQPSRRQLRDEEVTKLIMDLREANKRNTTLGSRKMWIKLRGAGHDVARCTVERLYRANSQWVEDQMYVFGAGSVFVTRPGELHGGVDSVIHPCELYWFQITAQPQLLSTFPADQAARTYRDLMNLPVRTFEASPALTLAIRTVVDEHRERAPHAGIAARAAPGIGRRPADPGGWGDDETSDVGAREPRSALDA